MLKQIHRTPEGDMRDQINNIKRYDYKGEVLIVRNGMVQVRGELFTSLDLAMKFVDKI